MQQKKRPPCGTTAGYHHHLRYDMPVCDLCRAARNVYARQVQLRAGATRAKRLYRQRTRHTALRRLVELHPEETAELYAVTPAGKGITNTVREALRVRHPAEFAAILAEVRSGVVRSGPALR